MTNYNDGKWHGWNGGTCPVHPNTLVQAAVWMLGTRQRAAVDLGWSDEDNPIIAFRVVKEYKEPREWWVNVYASGPGSLYETKEGAETGTSKSGKLLGTIKVREVIE